LWFLQFKLLLASLDRKAMASTGSAEVQAAGGQFLMMQSG
jgi:hypothetical protein